MEISAPVVLILLVVLLGFAALAKWDLNLVRRWRARTGKAADQPPAAEP